MNIINKINKTPADLKKQKYLNLMREVQFQEVKIFKTKETNQRMQKRIREVIQKIKYICDSEARRTKIKNNDYSTTLPPKLYKKVHEIIPKLVLDDKFETDENDAPICGEPEQEYGDTERHPEKVFNESTWSFLDPLEDEYFDVELKLPEEINNKKVDKDAKYNWQNAYICKNEKERIIWNSKLHTNLDNISLGNKSIYEKAEIMMNEAAERFTEFFNNLNSDHETDITKKLLLSLFALEPEQKVDILIDPKTIKAVPKTVAETWGVPELSVSLQLANKIKERNDKIPKVIIKHAFGKGLPYDMRPWVPSDADNVIKQSFPEELTNFDVMFKGILHLRTTMELAKHYVAHPELKRPEILKRKKLFHTSKINKPSYSMDTLYDMIHKH